MPGLENVAMKSTTDSSIRILVAKHPKSHPHPRVQGVKADTLSNKEIQSCLQLIIDQSS